MKKRFLIILSITLLMLCSCGASNDYSSTSNESSKSIVDVIESNSTLLTPSEKVEDKKSVSNGEITLNETPEVSQTKEESKETASSITPSENVDDGGSYNDGYIWGSLHH